MAETRTFHNFRDAVKRIANEQNFDLKDPRMSEFCMAFVLKLIGEGGIYLSHDEYAERHEVSEKVLARRDRFYASVIASPERYLETKNSIHVAGGILPVIFGQENHPLWRKIVQVAGERETIHFVHQDFSLRELRLIGRLARFLQDLGGILTCVDDRLWYAEGEYTKLVHDKCGACEGIGQVIGAKDSIEDKLHKEFAPDLPKRPIQPGMDNHRSTTIYMDAGPRTRTFNAYARLLARFDAALPFNASFPVALLERFIRENKLKDEDVALLLQAWTKFNVGVPRVIIEKHNRDGHIADETQLVINTNGVKPSGLLNEVLAQVQQVQHQKVLLIA